MRRTTTSTTKKGSFVRCGDGGEAWSRKPGSGLAPEVWGLDILLTSTSVPIGRGCETFKSQRQTCLDMSFGTSRRTSTVFRKKSSSPRPPPLTRRIEQARGVWSAGSGSSASGRHFANMCAGFQPLLKSPVPSPVSWVLPCATP